MTNRDRNPDRGDSFTRRRLLAAAGVSVTSGLAGCGYRPGGGDLAWESSLDTGGLLRTGERWLLPTDGRLIAVQNQSGRTFEFGKEEWIEVENAIVTGIDPQGETAMDAETENQVRGRPAITDSTVYLPVEDGQVTAIDRGLEAEVDRTPRTGDDRVRWRRDGRREGARDDDSMAPPVELRASEDLVVAAAGDGVVALDAATGERTYEFSAGWSAGSRDPDRVAVAGESVSIAVDDAGLGSERDADERGAGSPGLVRLDSSGKPRETRAVSDAVDWLAVAGDTLLAGSAAGETLSGYGPELDRRFTLDVPIPTNRPPVVSGPAGPRVYLRRAGTVRAVDVADGETAWERSDVPTARRFAVDGEGIYAVGSSDGDPLLVAIDARGDDWWTAPLPADVGVDEPFAVGDRLVIVDGSELYGLHASPGERWSLMG